MKWPANKYCNDIFNYSRVKTIEVMVGNVGIGGNNLFESVHDNNKY